MRFILLCLLGISFQQGFAQITLPDSIKSSLQQYIRQQADSIVQYKLDSIKKVPQAEIMPHRPFKYNIVLTGSFNEGNVNRKLLAFRSDFSFTKGILQLDMHPRFTFGEQNGQLAERESYVDVLLNIYEKNKIYGFLATNMEASNLRGITLRWLGGVGLGWRIIDKPQAKLSVTNMLMYEGTDFIKSVDILLWRNSLRLKGEYHLFKLLTIKHWLYFQPSITAQNFRWNGILSLEFPIYKNLQFRLNLEDIYESNVPEGRRNQDRAFTMGLSFSKK